MRKGLTRDRLWLVQLYAAALHWVSTHPDAGTHAFTDTRVWDSPSGYNWDRASRPL